MYRNKRIFQDLELKKSTLLLLSLLLLFRIIPASASAKQTTYLFEAFTTSTFQISGDVGNSNLFIVTESGLGEDATYGNFTFEAFLIQNLARIPAGCGPNSSTGVDGKAVLNFGDGTIRLKRTSGLACFSFPFVNLDEEWVVTSGTGNYVGVSGKLTRHGVGNVIDGSFVGLVSGTINQVVD